MDPRDEEIKRLRLIIEQQQQEIERLRASKTQKNQELELQTSTDTFTSDDDLWEAEPSGTSVDGGDTPVWPVEWFQQPLPVFTCGEVHPDWSDGPDRIRGKALYESVALLVEDDADSLRGLTASIIEENDGDLWGLMPSFQTATDLATEIRGGYSLGASAEVAALMTVVNRRIVLVLPSGEITNSAFISDFGAAFSHSKPIFLLCNTFNGQYYPMRVNGTAAADHITCFELKQDATRERLGYRALEDLTCSRHKTRGCWSCFCRTEMTRELAINHNRDDDGVIFTNSKGQRMCSPHWRQNCEDCYLDFRAVNYTSV